MLPTGFRTFHFVSFLYVFFFSFLFLLFRFFSQYFVFVFLRFVFFRFFSLLFSIFSFRFFPFRFFSLLFVFFRFSVYRFPNLKELMHGHCGTNNRATRWTFTDPCKPKVRPGAREESASPVWLAAPAMNALDTTKVYILRFETVTKYKIFHIIRQTNL